VQAKTKCDSQRLGMGTGRADLVLRSAAILPFRINVRAVLPSEVCLDDVQRKSQMSHQTKERKRREKVAERQVKRAHRSEETHARHFLTIARPQDRERLKDEHREAHRLVKRFSIE
jgi:hypothetical protein